MTDPKTVTVQERLDPMRPIVGIAYRTPFEVFAIMCERIIAERASMEGEIERLSESLFVLSDRLRASGILSASDAVHAAYEKVVADFAALTSSKTGDE